VRARRHVARGFADRDPCRVGAPLRSRGARATAASSVACSKTVAAAARVARAWRLTPRRRAGRASRAARRGSSNGMRAVCASRIPASVS
jgi:hypothetical protein